MDAALPIAFTTSAGRVTSDYAMLARKPETAPWIVVAFGRYVNRVVRRAHRSGWQFAQRKLVAA
jgi:hypothetical protein